MNNIFSHPLKPCLSLVALIIFSCSNTDDYDSVLPVENHPNRTDDFSLWQLAAFFHEVQMGYIIRTDDDKVIVVDGGGESAAPYLAGYLRQLGDTVHTWIVTHPHRDHIGALIQILENNDKPVEIKRLIHAPPSLSWVGGYEPSSKNLFEQYQNTLSGSGIPIITPQIGEKLNLGEGVMLSILGIQNPEIRQNAINNSSLVFKIESRTKSILFLGDMGPEGGMKIIDNITPENIQADYVQMAHHGQRGVTKEFYEAVGAKYALWPTPKWLWENKAEGRGYNTGNYQTLIVRQWMNELGIIKNYVSGLDGTVQID